MTNPLYDSRNPNHGRTGGLVDQPASPVQSMDIWQAYVAAQDEIASLKSLLKESEVRAVAYRDTMQALEKQIDASPTARAAVIEECAKLIESGAGMADLIDQDDLDQQAKYIRALQPATLATGGQHG